jgi:hypothetical protein
MKVLYIVKDEIDNTGRELIDLHREQADVSVIELNANRNYADIIKQVFDSDRVICW